MQKVNEKLGNFVSRQAILITAISVLTFAIGCYIININLSDYQIQDFDLVKPRAVYVGFVFLLLIAVNLSLYFLVPFDLINPYKFSLSSREFRLVMFLSSKLAIIALGIFYFVDKETAFDPICRFHFFKYSIDIKNWCWIIFAISSPVKLLISLSKKINLFTIINSAISSLSTGYLILLYFKIPFFYSLFGTQFCLLIISMSYLLIIVEQTEENIKRVKKIGEQPAELSLPKPKSQIRKIFLKFRNRISSLSKLAFGFIGIFICLIVLSIYSSVFYPKISQSLGGGMLEQITYMTNSGTTVSGDKIYETENYVFVLMKDRSITKLNWSDITKIVAPK